MARGQHFAADNDETYCYDKGEYDVRVYGDTVVVGPQPDSYCEACREVDPEWIPVTLEEFNRMLA